MFDSFAELVCAEQFKAAKSSTAMESVATARMASM
jgi:hypothetical protein